jgi:toxin ParE1/3/4
VSRRPPSHTIRLLRVGEDDLAEIITFNASDRASAAETMLTKIEKSIEALTRHPYLGKVPREEELARLGYRYLVVQNYLVFYTIESKTIYVHRILHGAHDYLPLF